MAKLELDSYKEMTPQAVRSWLVGSFVVATSTAVAVLVILTGTLARAPQTAAVPPAEAAEVTEVARSDASAPRPD